jgi:large subunit ribosomal protein L25
VSPKEKHIMDEDNKVVADARESFGKGAARKLRAVGKIPAVVYGHGTEPRHVALPAHQVGLLIRKANAVLDLQIDGKSQLALVKDVQKDPVRQIIEHLDLIVIRVGEKVQVEVPVHLHGESYPGTIADLDAKTLSLETEATHIPENIVVDIEGLEDGSQIHAKDVVLPKGSTLLSDPETLVVLVHEPQKVDLGEEAAEAAAEAEEAEAPEAAEEAAEAESAE